MKFNGWRAKAAKKFKATTSSNHKLPVAPNLLNQNFLARFPENYGWIKIFLKLKTGQLAYYLNRTDLLITDRN